MTAIITDVKYRMALSLIRDLSDHGIEVIACHSGEGRPYAFDSKGVVRTAMLPDAQAEPEAFLQVLAELCRSCREVPVVLPVGARSLALLAGDMGRKALEGLCHTCLSTADALDLANDKARLAALAREVGVPVPEEYAIHSDADFAALPYPVVLKPLCGEKQGLSAEQRYVIARDAVTAQKAYVGFTFDGQPPVVQQYIPGGGIGYSVLAKNGEIANAICHKRIREYPLSGGPSTCCEVIDGRFVAGYAAKLVKALNFTGLAMIEFKLDTAGNPYLLEINPRIWGTFPLTRASESSIGYDWYALASGRSPEKIPPKVGTRMYYLLSDGRRAVSVLKKGRLGEVFSSMADWLLPRAKEGIFEWNDFKASRNYLLSYLRRGLN